MSIYNAHDFKVQIKENNSPLTEADLASNAVICNGIYNLGSGWPILTEEGEEKNYARREKWQRYWLIDPLDGTKEFIRRNGEFTVNIALVENGVPILGVVYAPAFDVCYFGVSGIGAFVKKNEQPRRIETKPYLSGEKMRIVASSSHSDARTQALLEKIGNCECLSMGSSLKLCLVADGSAHFYPRLGPTMEWDTAAAHAIVRCAGGRVCDSDGVELKYNKPDLHNPDFFVLPDNGETILPILKSDFM